MKIISLVDHKIPCAENYYVSKERWISFKDSSKLKVILSREDFHLQADNIKLSTDQCEAWIKRTVVG